MRGNELNPGPVTLRASVGFLIPMRGNEDALIGSDNKLASTFLIPMRGNEIGYGLCGHMTARIFLIPMRGNEALNPCICLSRAQKIPNPHEG